jgi:ABC-type sugar transport system substrate-binding protein
MHASSRLKRLRTAAVTIAAAAAMATSVGLVSQPAMADSKGLIVVFMPPGTDNYLAQWQVGAKTKAKDLGYDIKIIESSRDQAEQDSQVQQQLASGEDVAGFIWWPYVNAAGTGSLRALSQTGKPVIFTNQYPIAGTEAFWTAYAGVDDFLNGKTAAQMMLDACAQSTTVKCGKGMIITFPAGYSAGSDRAKAFREATAGKLEVVQEEPAGFMSQEGYQVGSQIIPPKKDEITWVYTENDSLATGVIQALKEAGKTPGKDVLVVGGTCHGDTTDLLNGSIVGTGVQAAFLEGWQSVQTLHKYLNTKEVKDGKLYLEANPDTPPSDDGAPSRFNFIPNPALVAHDQATLDKFRLWGWSFKELCNY